MKTLEPGYLWVLRWRATIAATILIFVASVATRAIVMRTEAPFWLALMPVALALVLAIWLVFVSPRRRFDAWQYRFDDDELFGRSGVLVTYETVVPFRRVQHIDVARGPIERAYGVARLIVHTAGVAHAEFTLPGLSPEDAERYRDLIREHIRREPV